MGGKKKDKINVGGGGGGKHLKSSCRQYGEEGTGAPGLKAKSKVDETEKRENQEGEKRGWTDGEKVEK